MDTPTLTPLQEFVAISKYSRYMWDVGRREEFPESCWRYVSFFADMFPDALTPEIQQEIYKAMCGLEVAGSMRALMSAGPALKRNNIAGFNCGYRAVDDPSIMPELMTILMSGCGCGYSVEREEVRKLPEVPVLEDVQTNPCIVVEDSREGWVKAFRQLLDYLWYKGQVPTWDLSLLRPAGAVLKTFGGRSSGPEPLRRLFEFAVKKFKEAQGRKLNTLEVHDLVCMIAEVVVSGGVRRSALICLSNLSDTRLRDCKQDLWVQGPDGVWGCKEPQRQLSNNSVAYTSKPDVLSFMAEWEALIRSKAGERGIFNREAAQRQAARFGGRESNRDFGGNPCLEIILLSMEFCNLSCLVARPNDTADDLKRKVVLATILGTLQASLTDFKGLSPEWRQNSEEEALLGVSITGIMDHLLLSNSDKSREPELIALLNELRELSRVTNVEWAKAIGINPSKSWTTIKPSGNFSQLSDSASGIHARHSEYYIRRVRSSMNDPVSQVMIDVGVPYEPDLRDPENTLVFSFAVKSPDGAITGGSRSAIEQMELWHLYKTHWATHTVSITVTVKEDEWLEVGAWVYSHFDDIIGLSFLPADDAVYPQSPYEKIDEGTYLRMVAVEPSTIDWSMMKEGSDMTEGAQTLACVGGQCDV